MLGCPAFFPTDFLPPSLSNLAHAPSFMALYISLLLPFHSHCDPSVHSVF